jgi:NADH-quinone oxidoreductase subunit M
LINILFAAIVSLIQLDVKKAIAYGSIAHMGLVVAGLGESFYMSEGGAVMIMIFHGIVSPLLFFIVGSIYDRTATRNHYYFGSLSLYSPILATQ